MFHLPHGRATGIALPYSLEFIVLNPQLDHSPYPVERLGTAEHFVGIDAGTNQEGTKVFIQKIRGLERKVEEPLSLMDAGIT